MSAPAHVPFLYLRVVDVVFKVRAPPVVFARRPNVPSQNPSLKLSGSCFIRGIGTPMPVKLDGGRKDLARLVCFDEDFFL